ncbi:unnamed protein product [Pleuronectes platessa]|uniref:Uncharacterized protein n=1 Tax=Pleuronectes platessa TaxID=8262 RepID=A0A9N7YT12_PLEPL|nr:unnamed protein product [Pleuronectes platessa]
MIRRENVKAENMLSTTWKGGGTRSVSTVRKGGEKGRDREREREGAVTGRGENKNRRRKLKSQKRRIRILSLEPVPCSVDLSQAQLK